MRFRGFFVARSMCRTFGWLILAGVMFIVAAGESWARMPEPKRITAPVPATIKLAKSSGPALVGEITRWTRAELTLKLKAGTEQVVAWRDILPRQAYDIRRKLIDQKNALEWLDLGALMLAVDADEQANQAFAQAVKLDDTARSLVTICRSAYGRRADPQKALYDAVAEAEKPKEDEKAPKPNEPGKPAAPGGGPKEAPPGGSPPPAQTPSTAKGAPSLFIPSMSDADRALAIDELKQRTDTWFKKYGFRMRLTETSRWMFYSTLGEAEVRNWISWLDAVYETTAWAIGLAADANIYHGKCTVFIFGEEKQYVDFASDIFKKDVEDQESLEVRAFTLDDSVYLMGFKGTLEGQSRGFLMGQLVESVLIRTQIAASLSAPMVRAFGKFIVYESPLNIPGADQPWQRAKVYLQRGLDPVPSLLADDGPKDQREFDFPALAHMFVRGLWKMDPARFREWCARMSAGAKWDAALGQAYRSDLPKVVQEFRRDLLSEPAYRPVMK